MLLSLQRAFIWHPTWLCWDNFLTWPFWGSMTFYTGLQVHNNTYKICSNRRIYFFSASCSLWPGDFNLVKKKMCLMNCWQKKCSAFDILTLYIKPRFDIFQICLYVLDEYFHQLTATKYDFAWFRWQFISLVFATTWW